MSTTSVPSVSGSHAGPKDHMGLVADAIKELGEMRGSSRDQIAAFLVSNGQMEEKISKALVSKALFKGLTKGVFSNPSDSKSLFRLEDEEGLSSKKAKKPRASRSDSKKKSGSKSKSKSSKSRRSSSKSRRSSSKHRSLRSKSKSRKSSKKRRTDSKKSSKKGSKKSKSKKISKRRFSKSKKAMKGRKVAKKALKGRKSAKKPAKKAAKKIARRR